ncbi:MAG: Bifunctional homocysteine S-methyltransferase/5,10-methylenetetrahydrofolate reductase [Syntrophorhabdus sp. PtaU1.Bin002]|nr:MAG: Bifunctional homocysteine S-methyltransferase/5,10-methylenetetrahydrofolate reductase [Syntrophorhabdus sp. PtaU1.Bin002]
MKPDSKLAVTMGGKEFIFTAEYLPVAGTEVTIDPKLFGSNVIAVNVADNHHGVSMSSLAASLALSRGGIEPVFQIITRDRNRIALQSDLLGAAFLGMKNVLCLSGFHQTLIGCSESANVFDIDSVQLIDIVKKMNNGQLLDGTKIQGNFAMLIGAAANPNLKPLELNILRLSKKIAAGADFIQTQPVFDVDDFKVWLEAVRNAGLTDKTAILAGVMPLKGAAQAKGLADTYTDYIIPEAIINRLDTAGGIEAQEKEGVKIAAEIINKLRDLPGLKGVHILSGGNESTVSELSGLSQ